MSDLQGIPNINEASLELLEAAGFSDLESLAKAAVDELTAELARANTMLKIAPEAPSRDEVQEWVRQAREICGEPDEPLEESATAPAAVNREEDPEVAAQLGRAPFAIPLPARTLVENQLGVSDIPAAILLNRCTGELDARVTDRHASRGGARHAAVSSVQVAEPPAQRLDLDTSRVKSFDEYAATPTRRSSSSSRSKAVEREDRVALIRAPREETNRGVDPSSRRYIRGVLHSHPGSLAFGAVITLLLMLILPLAIVSGALLLLSDQMPETFEWVPKWLLVFPLALPVLGLFYLIWGLNGSCRICGQRLFMPRACRKNAKAHHIPGIGYIIPVAVHMLLFRWFRCTYCGTPVRLKK